MHEPNLKRIKKRLHGLRASVKLLSRFLTGQAALQFLTALGGLLMLRWLSKIEYAKYSVAFSFQSTTSLLVDFSMAPSMIALVGSRIDQPEVIGQYLRAAKALRNHLFAVCLPVSGVAFYLSTIRQPWSIAERVGLFFSITAAVYFLRWTYYGPVLLMHRKIATYYSAQIFTLIMRLLATGGVFLSGHLVAVAAAWINAASLAIQGVLYRKASHGLVHEPHREDPLIKKEIFQYTLQLAPSLLFFAFQGLITLLLVTAKADSEVVADVAALGRLGQLFTILGGFNGVILEPYFGRTSRDRRLTPLFMSLAGGFVVVAIILVVAIALPQPLQMLLGEKYHNVYDRIALVIISSSIGYLTSIFAVFNAARRLIYIESSFGYFITMILAQLVSYRFCNMTTVYGAVLFGLLTSMAGLVVAVASTAYGWRRGPRLLLSERLLTVA